MLEPTRLRKNSGDFTSNLKHEIKPFKKFGEAGNFKEFSSGAGTSVFKTNSAGVFAGAGKFSDAPFRLSYDGTVTSGSDTSYKVVLTGETGEVNFYYDNDLTGKIVATSDGNMYQEAQAGDHYFATPSKQILRLVSTGDVELRTAGSYIGWTSGRKITDASSALEVNGDFKITGTYYSDGDGGYTGDLEYLDHDSNERTATFVGGICTGI